MVSFSQNNSLILIWFISWIFFLVVRTFCILFKISSHIISSWMCFSILSLEASYFSLSHLDIQFIWNWITVYGIRKHKINFFFIWIVYWYSSTYWKDYHLCSNKFIVIQVANKYRFISGIHILVYWAICLSFQHYHTVNYVAL